MNTYLDLIEHDPEDYEGKLITWNGIDYVLGAYFASGASKIVHKLFNAQSGLCHHVIKIWRSMEEAQRFESREFPFKKLVYVDVIPPTFQISDNNGAYEIQNFLGPHEDEDSPTSTLMRQANTAIKDSDFGRAISIYGEVLNINPYHTVALINYAYTLAKTGQEQTAFNMTLQALLVESNLSFYYHAFFQHGGPLGYIRACRNQFEVMKSRLYLQKEDYEWGIDIYLSSGLPDKARELLEERKSIQAEENDQELLKVIEEDLATKNQAMGILNNAWKRLSTDKAGALKLLEKVRSMYMKEPMSVINMAIAFRNLGEYRQATELFLSMIYTASLRLVPVCLANAAFCATSLSDFDAAIGYFESAMGILTQGGSPIDPWDAPGIAIFVKDETTLEEPPGSAFKAISIAMEQYSKKKEVPSKVKELAELYRRAAEQDSE